CQQYTNSPFSV
nr:immunoglobulin light chain junction region [Macaca mulatta]